MLATILLLGLVLVGRGNRPGAAQDLQLDDLHAASGGLGPERGRLALVGRGGRAGIAASGLGLDSASGKPAGRLGVRPGDACLLRDVQVGGGDVKLIAMLGAFLGPEQGITAMLWTFVCGALRWA